MEESSFLNPARAVHAAKIHEGHLVADFGAGSGFFTRAAAREVGEGGEVWAVDINRDLLPRIKNLSAAENLRNVHVVHGDIESVGGTPLPPEHFDFVIISNVLFSAEGKKALVAEAKRVLKKVGRALVIDWSGSFGGLGPHESHVVTEREAKKLFEEAGFVFVEDVPAGAYHWGFVVRKKS
ncbi:MAG: class I SAM-dependent methyltransferase [bacterium]|nr:class I SAM-dependent methyltransferase [bacterium]